MAKTVHFDSSRNNTVIPNLVYFVTWLRKCEKNTIDSILPQKLNEILLQYFSVLHKLFTK